MIVNRTAAPSSLFSTADAKEWLRVDTSDDDTLIGGIISAVEAWLDGPNGAFGRAMLDQTWEAKRERLSGRDPFYFPVLPFSSLTSVSYFDADNVSQSFDVSTLTTYSEPDRAWVIPEIGTSWPQMYTRPDAITFTWVAGYGADVPENVIVAAKMLVSHYYENREAVVMGVRPETVPYGVADLLSTHRMGWISA